MHSTQAHARETPEDCSLRNRTTPSGPRQLRIAQAYNEVFGPRALHAGTCKGYYLRGFNGTSPSRHQHSRAFPQAYNEIFVGRSASRVLRQHADVLNALCKLRAVVFLIGGVLGNEPHEPQCARPVFSGYEGDERKGA